MTSQEQVLEIEAEDVGGTSPIASPPTTVFSQYGTGTFRFVARPRGAGPDRPAHAVIGATFPGTRPSIDDVAAQGAWVDIQRKRFQELHQQLLRDGWRPAGHGKHWWSAIYHRPANDNGAAGIRRQERDGCLLVVWDQRDAFTGEDQPPVPLDRPWPAAAATAVDASGHARPAEVGDGRLRLAVSADPLFVTAA